MAGNHKTKADNQVDRLGIKTEARGPAAPAPSGSWLETQHLDPAPGPTESESAYEPNLQGITAQVEV